MAMHAILKQIAQQLKGYFNSSDEGGYTLLYPFNSSRDYYSTPLKAFTDPRNGKEYILKYKSDEDRLAKLKKINTAITYYNKVAAKNYKEFISKLPPDGKVHSPDEFGFKKPTTAVNEIPLWGFSVMGRTGKDNSHKTVTIDNRRLYQLRLGLNDDSEFINHLNRQIFEHIQTKRKESEKMRTWDSENIWYKPNQRFHKWFQLKDINLRPDNEFQPFLLSRWAKEVVLLLKNNGEMKNNDIIIALNKRGMKASYQHISQIFKSKSDREFYRDALLNNGSYFSLKSKD